MTSFHPPLKKKYISLRYAGSPNRHQLYIVTVAKPYAWLQELCFWRTCDRPSSAVSWSLLNIVRFPPIRYCQISSAIAEIALYSRFGGHNGGVVMGEKRKCTSSIWFSWPTKAILPANQGDLQGNQKGPCVQVHAFATITMYSWWRFGELAYRSEIYFFF